MTLVVKIGRKIYEVNSIERAVQLLLSGGEIDEYHEHGEGD